MKLAITGGAGFIGRWLADAALAAGHEVSLIGRRGHVRYIEFAGSVFPYRPTDYRVDGLVEAIGPCDAIVHLAAERFGGTARFDLFEENLRLTRAVLETAQHLSVDCIVMLSSTAVYSSANPHPWQEFIYPSPNSLYGAAKLAAEALSDLMARSAGLHLKQLRAASVLGHGERPGGAAMTFIQRAYSGQPLEVWGAGRQRREYIYVKDVADAVLAALNRHCPAGVYNVGTGVDISIVELATLVNQVFDNRAGLVTRSVDQEFSGEGFMDIQKAREIMGWRPFWSLEAALADIRTLMVAGSHGVKYG